MQRMRSILQSVGTKLFLLVFCGVVVCVLSVGIFSYNRSKDVIQNLADESSAITVASASEKLGLMFDTIENILEQLSNDTNFQGAYVSLAFNGEDKLSLTQIESKLIEVVRSNKEILSGAAFIPVQSFIPVITVGSAGLDPGTVREADWVQRTIEANGKQLWLPLEPDGFGGNQELGSVGLSVLLKYYDHQFVILLEVPVTAIRDQISGMALAGGTFQIMDHNKGVVYSEDAARFTEPFLEALSAQSTEEERASGSLEFVDADGLLMLGVYRTFGSMEWIVAGFIPVDVLFEDVRSIRNLTWIMTTAAVLFAVLIGYVVIRMIAFPLASLRNLMDEGKQGNLTVRSGIRKKDEIGQLAQSFNEMMEQITALVGEANRSAQEVLNTAQELADSSRKTAQSAKEVAQATEDIAQGSSSLAQEAERGSAITEEMGQRLEDVVRSGKRMDESAGAVDQASGLGMQHMNTLIEQTEQAERTMQEMVSNVSKLKESAHSIRRILDMLRSITSQTNILSLNATIEASRAGEFGRGFKVVADEIRRLSAQSEESIQIAGQIVESVEHEVESAVTKMEEAYPIYRAQMNSVKETDAIFREVRSEMESFVAHLGAVSDSISRLQETQQTLSATMTSVSAVAEETSAATQQVASVSNEQLLVSDNLIALANRLETVSSQLRQSLLRFRVDEKA